MAEESTTPDLVEFARRALTAMLERDFDALEAFYAADAIFGGAEIGMFKGAATIRGLYEDLLSPYEEFEGEIEEIVDLGTGVAFAAVTFTGRPDGSSGVVQTRLGTVAVWTDGVLEQQTNYLNIDAARAAAERLAEERG